MTVLAFISGFELLLALFVGILLFGGRLPDVAKDLGRVFFRVRRQLNDVRRESGLDEVLTDLRREADQVRSDYTDLNLDAPFEAAGNDLVSSIESAQDAALEVPPPERPSSDDSRREAFPDADESQAKGDS